MKVPALRALGAALIFWSVAGPASAEQFVVTATFGVEGSLSGVLTTNASNTEILTYDITATSGTGPGGTFAGYEYTNLNSSPDNQFDSPFANTFQIIIRPTAGNPSAILTLQITSPTEGLDPTNPTPIHVSPYSYEYENPSLGASSGVYRYVDSGVFTPFAAVPEPASVVLTGSALAMALGFARLRRNRRKLA